MNAAKKYLLVLGTVIFIAGIYCFNPLALFFRMMILYIFLLSEQGKLLQRNSFRPVCDLSIMLDVFLWRKNAAGYHFTNLALHLVNAMLVFFFTQRLCKKYSLAQDLTFAFFTAALFFVYAMHSEAVFWILGRAAMLGSLFSLLFLIYFITKERNVSNYIIIILSFVLALLSYESSWVLLPVAFVLLLYCKEEIRKYKRDFVLLAAIFIVYLFMRYKVIGEIAGNYEAANLLHFDIKNTFTELYKIS